MPDPAIEAAQRVADQFDLQNLTADLVAAAREMAKPVQELSGAFRDFYVGRTDPFAEGVKHVLRDLAPLIYPTEELER